MSVFKLMVGKIILGGSIIALFGLFSCAETSYIYQNGSTYNDYEVANNYRIRNTTKKTKTESKAPNWRKYNAQNKYKRY